MNELEPTRDEPHGPIERVGPYVIADHIARTSTSEIFRARDEREDRVVALKMLHGRFVGDPDAEATFRREAEAMTRVRHPNLARVYAGGIAPGGRPYLAMEHIYGPTLERLIHDRMALSCAQRIDLASQACEGLQAAQMAGVAHRNIKPANLMVDSRSHLLKIVGLGLSWVVWDKAPPIESEHIVGSARYMSPEVIEGKPADHLSDIYSLGTVLYHLFAEQPAFDALTDREIMEAHLAGNPMPLGEVMPDLSATLCRIVMRMIERDRQARYQEYDSLIADLEEARNQELEMHDKRLRMAHTDQSGFGASLSPGATPPGGLAAESLPIRPRPGAQDGVTIPAAEIRRPAEKSGGGGGLFVLAIVVAILSMGALGVAILTTTPSETEGEPSVWHRMRTTLSGMFQSAREEEEDPLLARMYENAEIMRRACDAVRLYRAQHGEWPARVYTEDAWGRRMRLYDTRELLVSAGADGEMETGDDWVMRLGGELVRSPQRYRESLSVENQYSRKGRL